MKKIELNNKLSLNKQLVSKINDADMDNVNGGLKKIIIGSGCVCVTTTLNTTITLGIICADTATDHPATIISKTICEF